MKAGPACEELLVQQLDGYSDGCILEMLVSGCFHRKSGSCKPQRSVATIQWHYAVPSKSPIHSTSLLSFLQVVGSNPETAEKKVYLLVRATTQKSFYSLSDVLSFELQPWPQDLINSIMLVRCVKLKYYRVSEVESVKLQRILRMFKKKFRVFC